MSTPAPGRPPTRRFAHDPLDRRDFMKLMSVLAASWTVRAGAGTTPDTAPLNVVLIVSDQHRRNACGCFGSTLRRRDGSSPTPHIDALAARGVAFDAAYCPSPLCAPSRAAYMTGMYPHTTTALNHKMLNREAGLTRQPGVRDDLQGMGEYFRQAGYRTASVGKMHVHGELKDGWDLGFDLRAFRFYTRFPGGHYGDLKGGDINRRYRQLTPYAEQTYHEIDAKKFRNAPQGLIVKQNVMNPAYLETLVEAPEEMFDHVVADCSLSFIEECHQRQQPFFIHVGFEKPHEPWSVHQSYLDLFDPKSVVLPSTIEDWRERGMTPSRRINHHNAMQGDAARNVTAAYYACAASMDDQVGRLVARCTELGVLDRTIFVYTSDHGEMMFDHGLTYKHNMYEESVAVPFILTAPGLPQGTHTPATASLIDLIPTLQELTGLPVPAALEGCSLVAAAKGEADLDRVVFSEFYENGSCAWGDRYLPIRMAKRGSLKYIYAHGCVDELYDLSTDPQELNNLALDPAWAHELSRLRFSCLHDWELDEHPQLWIRGTYQENGVELIWQSAGPRATYEVWRETPGFVPERIAEGLLDSIYRDTAAVVGTTNRYWVVARHALTRPFIDTHGHARYGDTPVLAATYPRQLPITPALTLECHEGAQAEARYQPWHGLSFAGADWIFQGTPPVVEGAILHGSVPLALVSPNAAEGDVNLTFDVSLQAASSPKKEGIALVFGRVAMDDFFGVWLAPDGRVSIFRGKPERKDLAVAKDKVDFQKKPVRITLHVTSNTVSVTANGKPLLEWKASTPIPTGRYGVEASPDSVPYLLRAV